MNTTLTLDLNFMLKETTGLDDNSRMLANVSDSGSIEDFNIHVGVGDSGIVSRKFNGQFEENNRIRQRLVDALKVQFGTQNIMEIPESVRSAMKIGTWRDDMKIDAQGHVTSGRPLTARRIRAVISAVEAELASAKGIENAWKNYKEECRLDNNREPHRGVFEFFKGMVNEIPVQRLDMFDDGIDTESFENFGKMLKDFENDAFAHMSDEYREAVEGGDGTVWRMVVSDIVVGRIPKHSRLALKNYINSKECVDYMNEKIDAIAFGSGLSDEEFRDLNHTVDYLVHMRNSIAGFYNQVAVKVG